MSSADGHLCAIDSKGYLRWKFKTKDLIEFSPVIAEDGTIIVGSGDNKLYAVNSDGTPK
ncbi:MAG: PQQ-binding-like beta-propeller repeat protein [Planctomycetota bacterium]